MERELWHSGNRFVLLFGMLMLAMFAVCQLQPVLAQAAGPPAAVVDSTAIAAPTQIVQSLVDAITKGSGGAVTANMALTLLAVLMIAVYRVLQWVAGKSKTPMGTMGTNALAGLIALLFGNEAAWKNRVLARGAPKYAAREAKLNLLDKLRKDQPLLWKELNTVRDSTLAESGPIY